MLAVLFVVAVFYCCAQLFCPVSPFSPECVFFLVMVELC